MKKFTMKNLITSHIEVKEFTEETAPDWLTSRNSVPRSTMDMSWFWKNHVLKLKVGQHVDTDANRITRIK